MNISQSVYEFCNNLVELGFSVDNIEIDMEDRIFMELLSELDLYQKQGDLFEGFAELPDHVMVGHLNGHIKVNRKSVL